MKMVILIINNNNRINLKISKNKINFEDKQMKFTNIS